MIDTNLSKSQAFVTLNFSIVINPESPTIQEVWFFKLLGHNMQAIFKILCERESDEY